MAEPRTCGYLLKKSSSAGNPAAASTWHQRYFVLYGDTLCYYVNEDEADDHPATVRGSIPLLGAGLYTAVHARYGARYFELHVPSRGRK